MRERCLTGARAARVITMATGNIVCIISAACLTYLPADQKWNRLVAYWFTSFQVGLCLVGRLRFADL